VSLPENSKTINALKEEHASCCKGINEKSLTFSLQIYIYFLINFFRTIPERLNGTKIIASSIFIELLLFFSTKDLRLWDNSGRSIFSLKFTALRFFFYFIIFIFLHFYKQKKFKIDGIHFLTRAFYRQLSFSRFFSLQIICLGLFVILISNWLHDPYNIFIGPTSRGELLVCGLLSTILGLRYLFTKDTTKEYFQVLLSRIFGYLLITAIVICIYSFFKESNGRLLFSDDHSTFFYRLTLLKKFFPNIPFYMPFWNGGIDARDFFASGSLNIFTLFSPIIFFTDLERSYNVIIAILLFVLVPLSTYVSVKILKLEKPAASLAALLSLSTNLLWYRWALKYGTLGFITSSTLLPLVFSLASKAVHPETSLSFKEALLLIFVTSLTVMWTPAGIVFVPTMLYGLFSIKKIIKKKHALLILVSLCCINIPWMTLFWSVSKVSSFITIDAASSHTKEENNKIESITQNAHSAKKPKKAAFRHTAGFNIKKSLKIFREHVISGNPLILLLGLPGIFLLSSAYRKIIGFTSLWIFFLGFTLVTLKPQLELDRMYLIMYMLLCIPASLSILHILKEMFEARTAEIPIRVVYFVNLFLIASFLLVSPLSASAILRNYSIEKYSFADDTVKRLVDTITMLDKNRNSRFLFTGCVVHDLSNGHLAPLVTRTKSHLIASSYVHNLWRYTQIFPSEYISKHDQGIEEYMNYYNVEFVLAHEPMWREYFLTRKDRYEMLVHIPPFVFFRRKEFIPNWIFEGKGAVKEFDFNKIIVKPETESLILKANYFNFLIASACTIKRAEISEHVHFIKLEDCPVGEEVTIKADTPWKRIFMH
jgi:hypothetical protein